MWRKGRKERGRLDGSKEGVRRRKEGSGGLPRKQLVSLLQRCGRLLVLSYKMVAFLVHRGREGERWREGGREVKGGRR